MINENKETGKETEKEKVQEEVNGITVYNNQKLELPTSSNLLNNPSDFIITQNPLEDLSASTSAIIHIKNTCKNSFFNCYVNCCFGHSITFNTFLNINQNMKYLFQSTASIIPGFTCLFKRNIELQASLKSFTKSSPEEISSNSGTPYALMDKIDSFSCCNYKEVIVMPVKIIPENRIAGTVVLKPLKEKCPCPGCECLLYYCYFPCFPIIPCISDCCIDCNPKSDTDTDCCKCPKFDCGCGCDCSKICSDDPNRCCCGLCLKPNCCCCAPNRCCCGLCPKPDCACCDDNRSCCGLCEKSNSSCCCCCCCSCSGVSMNTSCKTFDYYSEIYDAGNVLRYYVFFLIIVANMDVNA